MKDKIEKHGQQGDVIMRKVGEDRPLLGEVVSKGRCILARGEGHHIHVIDAEETDAELIAEGDRMLLWLSKPATIHHIAAPTDESAPLALCGGDHESSVVEAGLWEVGGVREVDHFQQLERRVVD